MFHPTQHRRFVPRTRAPPKSSPNLQAAPHGYIQASGLKVRNGKGNDADANDNYQDDDDNDKGGKAATTSPRMSRVTTTVKQVVILFSYSMMSLATLCK